MSAADDTPAADRTVSTGRRTDHLSALGPVVAPVVVALLPLLVGVIALHGRHWFPAGDLAQGVMKVRDVPAHLPLLGAAGRIRDNGSHPGPLMWYLLAPGYRLFGSSPWAVEASAALVDALWLVAIAWVAHRRGGRRLLLAVVVVTAVLMRSYGTIVLTEPWNPSVPLLAFLLFLLLVWSVLSDDLKVLPLAVAAGTYCVQAHVGYAPLVLGLLGPALIWAVVRRRADGTDRRPQWRALAVAALVVAALWVPPVVEQLTAQGHPGNLTLLYRNFSSPDAAPIGLATGVRLLLVQVDPFGSWLTGREATSGPVLPGLLLVILWAGSTVLAWRRRHFLLLRLDAVIALALALSAVAMSRIFGSVFVYLLKWSWAYAGLMVLAIGWTAWDLVSARQDDGTGSARTDFGQVGRALTALLVTALLVTSGLFAIKAVGATEVDPFTRSVRLLTPSTAAHLNPRTTYLIAWDDPISLGAVGFGLQLALEERGFHLKAPPQFRAAVTPHRIARSGEYGQVIHVITGPAVADWRRRGDAVQIATADPRSAAQRRQFVALSEHVVGALRRTGHPELVPVFEASILRLAFDPRTPKVVQADLGRLVSFGLPSAVFLSPPGPQDGVPR